MITIKEINTMLAERILEVCGMLFPMGKLNGKNYEVGSISGESGQSLKIPTTGNNLGMFKDFTTDDKGDIVELWRFAKGVDFKDAIAEIKSYLGLKDDYNVSKISEQQKNLKPIDVLPPYDLVDQVPEWSTFLSGRGISPKLAAGLKVGVYNGKLFFPHYQDDKPVMWHTRSFEKDKNGNVILDKDGNPKKEFRASPGTIKNLWGWNGIKNNDRFVVITEGRLDALSYIEQGIPALSVPFGGGSGNKQDWIDTDYHRLIEHFEKIYISMDFDAVGEDAKKEIVSRIGEDICYIVTIVNKEGKIVKDANKAHTEGIDLKKCIQTARQITPEGLHRPSDFLEDAISFFYPDEKDDQGIFFPWIKCQEFQARLGEVTLIAGGNGDGKTHIINNIMLGGFEQDRKFGVASMEMIPKRLLGRLIKCATATDRPDTEYIKKAVEYLDKNMWIYNKKGTADRKKILSSFLYLRKRYGVTYFVIDSLSKCGISDDDYDGQKVFIDQLEDFAHDNMVHIFLVHHIRKKDDKTQDKPPSKNDVKGSGGIVDMIDNLWIIWRNRPKEDFLANIRQNFETNEEEKKYKKQLEKMEKMPDVIFYCAKQRNGDWEKKVGLWFDLKTYQYLNDAQSSAYRYVKYSRINNNYENYND